MLLIDQFKLRPALEDDLNTPLALAELEKYISSVEDIDLSDEKFLVQPFVQQLDEVFGLDLLSEPDITDEQKQLIAERQKTRDDKNWARSDELRGQLEEQGIGLRDTPRGAIWYRL